MNVGNTPYSCNDDYDTLKALINDFFKFGSSIDLIINSKHQSMMKQAIFFLKLNAKCLCIKKMIIIKYRLYRNHKSTTNYQK